MALGGGQEPFSKDSKPPLPTKQQGEGEDDSANDACFVLLVTTLDSLSYTSAISVAFAVVFVVITSGIAIVKLIRGQIPMPKLFPAVPDWHLASGVSVCLERINFRKQQTDAWSELHNKNGQACFEQPIPPVNSSRVAA